MTFCNARSRCTEAGVSASSSSALFEDFQQLQAIWTHPFVLKQKTKTHECTKRDFDDDCSDDHSADASECSNSDSETNSEENGKQLLDFFFKTTLN